MSETGLGPNTARERGHSGEGCRGNRGGERNSGDVVEPGGIPELVLSTAQASEHWALQQFYQCSLSSSELLDVPVQPHSFSSCLTLKCLHSPSADRLKMECDFL